MDTNYQRKLIGISFVFLLILVTSITWFFVLVDSRENKILTVAFLDVGQGDAIYIEAPNGNQLLIDGGADKAVLRELSEQMPFWDRSINMVVASHPDNDHVGGIPSVINRFAVETLLEPGIHSDKGAYEAMVMIAEKKGTDIIHVRSGKRYIIDDGVYLDILFPDRDVSGIEANTGSIIARLTYNEISFLFTGDAPKSIEKYMVAIYGTELNVDVLKLGHHGSKTSSSLEFLGFTSPKFAVISAGKNNSYGHPHDEVTERLEKLDIEYFVTGDIGTIVFKSDGEKVYRSK